MDVEGVVSVRFTVGADGSPVISTLEVVTSPNPLLTSAVRRVIPEMQFEPARVSGASSRAIADVVQIDFRFTSRPR
jgi:TonB family protein